MYLIWFSFKLQNQQYIEVKVHNLIYNSIWFSFQGNFLMFLCVSNYGVVIELIIYQLFEINSKGMKRFDMDSIFGIGCWICSEIEKKQFEYVSDSKSLCILLWVDRQGFGGKLLTSTSSDRFLLCLPQFCLIRQKRIALTVVKEYVVWLLSTMHFSYHGVLRMVIL